MCSNTTELACVGSRSESNSLWGWFTLLSSYSISLEQCSVLDTEKINMHRHFRKIEEPDLLGGGG
jgi:hypothetical protein